MPQNPDLIATKPGGKVRNLFLGGTCLLIQSIIICYSGLLTQAANYEVLVFDRTKHEHKPNKSGSS